MFFKKIIAIIASIDCVLSNEEYKSFGKDIIPIEKNTECYYFDSFRKETDPTITYVVGSETGNKEFFKITQDNVKEKEVKITRKTSRCLIENGCGCCRSKHHILKMKYTVQTYKTREDPETYEIRLCEECFAKVKFCDNPMEEEYSRYPTLPENIYFETWKLVEVELRSSTIFALPEEFSTP